MHGDFGVSFRRSSLQFNIRPWRFPVGQSVATAGATSSIRQTVHADGAFGARKKRDWDSPQRPRIEPRHEKTALYVFAGFSAFYRAPSAIRPTAQHQHANSRAVATFALFLWTPRSSRAARLSTSRRTPFDACRLAAGSGAWPDAGRVRLKRANRGTVVVMQGRKDARRCLRSLRKYVRQHSPFVLRS